jgi:hypothetical protein
MKVIYVVTTVGVGPTTVKMVVAVWVTIWPPS